MTVPPCKYCGLSLAGPHTLDLHVARLHNDTPEGAAKAQQIAIDEESRRLLEGNFPREEPQYTFGERFLKVFRVLERSGYGPKWEPLAGTKTWDFEQEAAAPDHRSLGSIGTKRAEIITCRSGPIVSVDMSIQTDVVEDSGFWQTHTEVCLLLRAEWTKRWMPELILLRVDLDFNGIWIGNDWGLGIIDQLNILPRQSGRLNGTWIEVRPRSRQIQLTYPGPATKDYRDGDAVPPIRWRIPSEAVMRELLAAAETLITDPPYLPSRRIRPSEIPGVPAPRSNYFWWAGYPIFLAIFLTGGLASIFWNWPERYEGGFIVFGSDLLELARALRGRVYCFNCAVSHRNYPCLRWSKPSARDKTRM